MSVLDFLFGTSIILSGAAIILGLGHVGTMVWWRIEMGEWKWGP